MKLSTIKTITITPAVTITTDTITITNIIDNQQSVVVDLIIGTSILSQLRKRLILWDSTTTPSYSSVGNWTQEQAEARIIELL